MNTFVLHITRISRLSPACILALFLTACASPPLHRFEFTRLCMGVQTKILTWAPDHNAASTAAAAAFSEIGRLDTIMSDYQKTSELNRLSDGAGGPPIAVSDDLFSIIRTAQDVSRNSGGAFDITVGPAVQLWREARRSGRLPTADQIAAARALIDYRTLVIGPPDSRSIRLTRPGTRLDLGAIAKGYAAQRALDVMRAQRQPRSLVALSGDIAAGDPPPGEPGWTVALEGEQSGKRLGVLVLGNSAVSTSGDTEQFVQIAGQRFSHIIDPKTGTGIQARRAVSIVYPAAMCADPLATAACILGPDATPALLARYQSGPVHPAAIFEEATPQGLHRTVIDPDHALRWVQTPDAGATQTGTR